MQHAETLKQVETEALRRAKEDDDGRLIYITEDDTFAISIVTESEPKDELDYPVGVAWPDGKMEIFTSESY